jgi:hypothetical protein
MAVTSDGWPVFAHILKLAKDALQPIAPIKTLSLGTTDFLLTGADIAAEFGDAAANAVQVRADSQAISTWHGRNTDVVDAKSLYDAIGFDVDFVDIAVIRGSEIVQDMNLPLAPELENRYHLVIDSGTLEHCFNIGQAMVNVVRALKVGGIAYHGNPLLMMNHGFFNFCPTFYHDFYTANGFKIMELFGQSGQPRKLYRMPATDRFKLATPEELTITAVAQKLKDEPVVWPTQTKYAANPMLKG